MNRQACHQQLTRGTLDPPSSAYSSIIPGRLRMNIHSRRYDDGYGSTSIVHDDSIETSKNEKQQYQPKATKEVSFKTLEIIEFPYTIGDICCDDNGPSLACSWNVQARTTLDIGYFERYRSPRRPSKNLALTPDVRKDM